MKNTLKLSLSIVSLFIIIASFTIKSNSDYSGTYGDSIMKLELNENHTFNYNSSFDSQNVIKEKGTWEIKKGNVYLQSNNKALPLKWKVKNNGKTIKARNGMIFYTLQKKD